MLTPLPTIPTDSFYKFKAIAGIWLVVGSIGGASVAIFKYQNEWYDARMRAASLQSEVNAVGRRIDADRGSVSEAKKLPNDLPRVDEEMNRARLQILLKRAEERAASISSLELETARLRVINERFRFLSTGFIVTMTALAPLFVCGLLLARSGLREWRDLQSEQDAFLRRQWSESLPPENPPAPPALPSSPVPPT